MRARIPRYSSIGGSCRRQSTSTRLMREERKNEAHSEIGCADTFDGPDAENETRSTCRDLAWTKLLDAASYRASPHFRDQCTRHLVRRALRTILACCLEPQATLVWRQDVTARFRPLGPEEAMMWNEAASDTRFDVLYEMVATYGGEDGADFRAASYLKDWVDMGGLADRRLSS